MKSSISTKVVNLIDFHGLTLWVVAQEGAEYVYAKPLSDLAGIDWRSAKRTIMEEENVILYGSRLLNHPSFAPEGGTATPSTGMFLARINTKIMKCKGAAEAAERLLALQVEWARALHQYEANGVAYKRVQKEGRSELIGLIKARSATGNAKERDAITRMIGDTFYELGYPLNEIQREMDI